MTVLWTVGLVFGLIFATNAPARTVEPLVNAPNSTAPGLSWSDIVDLTLAAPVVIHARTDNIRRISNNIAHDVPAGEVRVLVEAKLQAALKAPEALAASAAWQWQGPAAARKTPPFARDDMVIAFLRRAGHSGDVWQYQLVAPHAQLPWTPELESDVRGILREARNPQNQGLMVTGVSDGFRTEGTVHGQSESQFFLTTIGGRPLTLNVLRQPEFLPTVTLATGDMVDKGQPVRPRTLGWHALACGLPAELPARLAEVPGLNDDYILAQTAIGPCGRTIKAP